MGDAHRTSTSPGPRGSFGATSIFTSPPMGRASSSDDDFSVDIRSLEGAAARKRRERRRRHAKRGTAWELDGVRLALGRTNLSCRRPHRAGGAGPALRRRHRRPEPSQTGQSWKAAGPGHVARKLERIRSSTPSSRAAASSTRASRSRALDAQGWILDASGGRASNIQLHAKNLLYSERTLSGLDFKLTGSAGDHTVSNT